MLGESKWQNAGEEERLETLVGEISEVCTVSESAQNVMQLTQQGQTNTRLVVDAVMKDPALASELLRIVNSPFYGQSKKVSELHRAVVLVGMQELHTMAAGMSMMAAFSSDEEVSQSLRNTSVLSATLARFLAREIGGVDETAAFLSGLLCEIGAMACATVDTAGYRQIWDSARAEREQRANLEKQRYTASSPEIGALLIERNHLPGAVANAIRGSEEEEESLTRITVFARFAAPLLVRAAEVEDPQALVDELVFLAEKLGFGAVGRDRLLEMCVTAGTTAELGLRGDLILAAEEEVEAEEKESDAPDDIVLPIDVDESPSPDFQTSGAGATVNQVRMSAETKTSWTPVIVGVAIVVGAAAAAATYFLFF